MLMGEKGLIKRGYLNKEGPKLYSLTPTAKTIVGNHKQPTAGKRLHLKVNTEEEKRFLHYFDSLARHKVDSCAANDLRLIDAMQFWGISGENSDTIIAEKLRMVTDCLGHLEALLREEKEITLSNGLVLVPKEIQSVRQTHDWLREKFRRHLKLLEEHGKSQ